MTDYPIAEDLLPELDQELTRLGLHYRLIGCGGFVMQQCYYGGSNHRKTIDLDTLTELDDQIRLAAMKIGRRLHDASPDETFYWLNNRVREGLQLHKKLPKGWEERSFAEPPIYQGKNLILYPLPRQEMILSKLHVVLADLTTGSGRRLPARLDQDILDLRVLGYHSDMIHNLLDDFRRMMPWYKRWFISRRRLWARLNGAAINK